MKILDVPQSGSQAVTTSSRNRFGQYRRTRAMPTQPRTAAQMAVRNNLVENSKAWGGLTDEQRAAWTSYAGDHPRVDSLGQTQTLTGHMMYVAVNGLILASGGTVIAEPPTGAAIATPDFSLTATTAAGLSGKVATAIPVAAKIIVSCSPPMSAGRSFNGNFRIVKALSGTNAADQVVITAADVAAKFGALVAGKKLFLSVEVVNAGNVSSKASIAAVLT